MSLLSFAKRVKHAAGAVVLAAPHRKDYKGDFWSIVFPRLRFTLFPTVGNADIYNKAVLRFLNRHLPMPATDGLPQPEPAKQMRIWVMWWQGAEQMPPIVRICYDSLLRHTRGLEVVLITRNNVVDFVKIPDVMQRKLDEGNITLAALSDYVRVSLLSDYGGIWIDSTMFFVRDIPEAAVASTFFTIRRSSEVANHFCVSHSEWNGQFLASNMTHSKLFELERKMWEYYWDNFDSNIEYLMTDFFKARIFATCAEARQLLDAVKHSNNSLYKLAENLNTTYDDTLWQQMCENEECFKLTLKMAFVEGNTFYQRLIDGKLSAPAINLA